MEKKPNQIIDEITEVIYPPAEAIANQLATIRAIVTPTIKMYEQTKDIHTIQPNLDMIQRAIDYLRGAPMQDDLRPTPEDTIKPVYVPSVSGVFINSALNRNGEYDVSITGPEVESKILHPELFGDINFDAIEIGIEVPVICGSTYLILQENPMLEHYKDDPTISEKDGLWTKEKEYKMEEDFFQYNFLLGNGRSNVKINIIFDEDNIITFNITSHIHFKKQEVEDSETSSTNG